MKSNTNCMLWVDGIRTPYENMALDELLPGEAARLEKIILRFYKWDRPAASFGYSQKPAAVPREGLALVRRPTGGGVVFHENDLTYTFAIPAGHWICRDCNRLESYKVIHEPVMAALSAFGGGGAHLEPDRGIKHDRATLQCFVSPSPNDVMADDGSKLAGAAQRRTREGILHQGSVALSHLNANRDEARAALEKSFRDFLRLDFEPFEPRNEFLSAASELARSKYITDSWNNNGEFTCGKAI